MFSELFYVDFPVTWAIVQVIQGLTQSISPILMLIGVHLAKPRLVIPYLIAQLLMLITTGSFFVLFILSVYYPDSIGKFTLEIFLKIPKEPLDEMTHNEYVFIVTVGIFMMSVLCFFVFCFELWTLRVSFQCYNYLLDVFDASEGTNRLPPLRMERGEREEITIVGMERIQTVFNPLPSPSPK
ncbi:hypothetical protein PENTCL1PPCAC_6716 [Pristionchus entomophagus]|uniref:Ion channel n=1 Tax=Pristionchus entomophagus TaxID=358040 RepID=A0AAV5SMT1_9BILA|nr:hypothetical protein PENTCL1PPCAC_6716 [Pristionchus entomophagus]